MPSPEKFKESLIKYSIESDIIEKINVDYEELVSGSPKIEKREYFKRAMEVFDMEVPHDIVADLMDDKYRCAGHFRYHYQIMLDCTLKLDRVFTSPLDSDGQEPCSFIFQIENKA